MSPRTDPTLDKLTQELRRGGIVLAVLAALRVEHYGYSLRQTLQLKGLVIEEGTLYPLIRRLEQQGLLISEWREDQPRRKRYYWRSEEGERIFKALRDQWQALSQTIDHLVDQE